MTPERLQWQQRAIDAERGSLDWLRAMRRSKGHALPDDAWYPDAEYPQRVCCFCGDPDRVGDHVNDHCHITGLYRGTLCRSCNSAEPYGRGEAWELWRTTAPGLTGGRWLYSHPHRIFTREEALTAPVAELLARWDTWRLS